MTDSPFLSPDSTPAEKGPNVSWEALNGALLVIEPVSVERGIKTVNGVRDAVKATVNVLDGPLAGRSYPDTLVFPRALFMQLSNKVGGMVLGRLGKGEAGRGQNPPWKLFPATADDEDAATVWLAARNAAPLLADDDLEAPF